MMRPAVAKCAAALLLAGLAGAAALYPLDKALLAVSLCAYCALLWWRPHAWLIAVPALLPVLDLAPWTGWYYLDELDLLLLATCAVGYARIGADDRPAALPPLFAWSLGLVVAAWLIAAWIGATPIAPLDANAFASYSSRYNSVRTAKGLAWALLLLPLLQRGAGPALASLRRLFVPGMLLGLAGAAIAVMTERALFPGLSNFASDYRPTGMFSAMHTGGAALDAYLALSFPFVAAWLVGPRTRIELAAGLLLLLLGSYAGLALFSRDIYVAYGMSGAIVGALLLARRARHGRLHAGSALAIAALLAVTGWTLARVFASGGYRGLACALTLLAASFVLAGAPGRLARRPLVAGAALLLLATTALLAARVDKGAYLGFAIAAAAFGAGAVSMVARRRGAALAAAALPALALGAGLVAFHWGGGGAAADIAAVALLAAAGLAASRLRAEPLVRLDRTSLTALLCAAIAMITVIPLSSSYFMGERFATVGTDIDMRLRHWREAVGMMDQDSPTALFGMGLGRYPDVYTARNWNGELPGSFRYEAEAGKPFLRLGAPQHAIGHDQVVRLLQRVDVVAGASYRLGADIRPHQGKGIVMFALCERWMLYSQACVAAPLGKSGAPGWTHYEAALTVPADHLNLRPVQLEFSLQGAAMTIDVANVSLRPAGGGADLLRNGDFARANTAWFFSSDHDHMPWHIKNVAVNLFFEQGWAGLTALALLLLYLGADLVLRAIDGEDMAAVYLAALAGFLCIGAFDSLFDVPRLTLLFFLVACAAALRPAHATRPAARHVRRAAAPAAQRVPARQAENSSNAP
ncbi:MAG: hypothetical protein QFF03_02695 [Pseudomonadota bacterium]|nr:hypothetical protein [Pseudomonadota bacterium]MDL2354148.1 hypothetical protein [Pseudomonadota bacterium]